MVVCAPCTEVFVKGLTTFHMIRSPRFICLLSSVRTIPGWTAYAATPVSEDTIHDRSKSTPLAQVPSNFPIYLIFQNSYRILTLELFGQGASEKDIGQFTLTICPPTVVIPLTIDIIKCYCAPTMSHGGNVDDSWGGRSLQQINQQEG